MYYVMYYINITILTTDLHTILKLIPISVLVHGVPVMNALRKNWDTFVYSQKSPVFGQFLFNAIVFSVEGQANRELKEPSSEKIIIKPDMLNPNFTLDSSRTGTSLVIPEVIKNQTGNGFRILDLSLFSNFQTDYPAHSKFQWKWTFTIRIIRSLSLNYFLDQALKWTQPKNHCDHNMEVKPEINYIEG